MVYSNRFVMALIANGSVQKEHANGEIHLLFDTEYTLRFRNKHDRAAVVKIYIDGENVSADGYRIPAHGKIDIKRHSSHDAAFRFIDLDSPEAIENGKNGPNVDKVKGVIEARFYLEKQKPKVEHHYHPYPVPYYPQPWYYPRPWIYPLGAGHGTVSGSQGTNLRSVSSNQSTLITNCSMPPMASFAQCNPTKKAVSPSPSSTPRDGCTVEGNSTGQKFTKVFMDLEDDYVVLKLFLRGVERARSGSVATIKTSGNQSVVTEAKQHSEETQVRFCTNCGSKRQPESAKFCGECGQRF